MKNENSEKNLGIEKSTFKLIMLFSAILLLLMPFITTFNDVLTRFVMKIELYKNIQAFVAPIEIKFITLILNILGIKTLITTSTISVWKNMDWKTFTISWNCIGWQSMILLFITYFVGLAGNHKISSKIECFTIGILGIFLANILRMALVVMIGYLFGSLPAIIFHDYFGNILMIVWLIFFWWFSYAFVLTPKSRGSDAD
ncbi:MAG: hypothetical protein GTN40_05790 [Candidatus Aenigmarchaeota archaeon]|nr:hypothetical protein [Candidatus Aenigmarchaeota archaeon]